MNVSGFTHVVHTSCIIVRPMIAAVVVLFVLCLDSRAKEAIQEWARANSGDEKPIKFDLDFATFRYDERRAYVEVYYGLSKRELAPTLRNGVEVVAFAVELFCHKGDSLVNTQSWNSMSPADHGPNGEARERMSTLAKLVLEPGAYTLRTQVTDEVSGAQASLDRQIVVDWIRDDRLVISDIELAYNVLADTTDSRYVKNNYKVVPNASLVYDLHHPILYFYAEVYNLQIDHDSTYTARYEILNDQNESVKAFPSKTRRVSGKSLVEVGGLSVVSLQAGAYYFKLSISDDGSQRNTERTKKFYIYRPDTSEQIEGRADNSPLARFYSTSSEQDIEQEFEMAEYLATPEEREIFKTLDVEGKRVFLTRFWSSQELAGEQKPHEVRHTYFLRVAAANQRFQRPQQAGWKTDRGRVFILYGNPDEIERNPSLGETRGYERWYYRSSEQEMLFVFVDKMGWDELELVHSTARGEVYDPDWERWISVR